MSKLAEVDMSKLSEAHLNNVKKVYAFIAFILDEQSDLENLTVEELEQLHTVMTEVKLRDGFLKYFSTSPRMMRLDILTSLTVINQSMISKDLDVKAIGYTTMVIAGLLLCHTGMKQMEDEAYDTAHELKLVDGLIKDAEALDCDASLLQLLAIARRHNIPPRIFYDSLEAVGFEECTRPTGESNDDD